MGERSCWACIYFSNCRGRLKGRKYQLWNAPDRFFDFYRLMAKNCTHWEEDPILKVIVENRLRASVVTT